MNFFHRRSLRASQEHFSNRKPLSHLAIIIGGRRRQFGKLMKQIKAYREAQPDDLAFLLLSVGEIGAMVFSAALVLVLVWVVGGPS
jgi:hypothetical protein